VLMLTFPCTFLPLYSAAGVAMENPILAEP